MKKKFPDAPGADKPPSAPKPPGPARLLWRRVEVPVVLLLSLGLVGLFGGLTALAGRTPDDFAHNAATALWPADGTASDISVESGGVTEPGTTEHARLRGYETLAGIPSPLAAAMATPEGDLPTSHWWRSTSTRFTEVDRRILVRQATERGTLLYLQAWGDKGVSFVPALIEVPGDVQPGASWESSGRAGIDGGSQPQGVEYHNRSAAETPDDPAAADRGCLTVTSDTELGSTSWQETSLWCPGEGVTSSRGTWNGAPFSFTPADRAPIGDGQVEEVPALIPEGDPADWQTGMLAPAMEVDEVFGVNAATLLPGTPPMVTGGGSLIFGSQINGDVITMWPRDDARPEYPAGTPLVEARGHPGGEIVADGMHRNMVTVTTTERRLSMMGGNGVRRWTITLDEVAASAPVSLDAERIAVATLDGRVRVLEARTGAELWNTRASEGGISLPLRTDGRTIAAVDTSDQLILLDAESGEVLSSEHAFGQPVVDLAVDDGRVFVSVGGVLAYDARTGDELWQTTVQVPGEIAISEGRLLVLALNATVVLDPATGAEIARHAHLGQVLAIDGGFVALQDNEIRLLDQEGNSRHSWPVNDVAAADTLVVGGGRIWALEGATMTGMWVQP